MNRMEFLENGKIAFTYITLNDEEEVKAEEGDHEGIVEIGRDIEGVEVSIFLHQKDEKKRPDNTVGKDFDVVRAF